MEIARQIPKKERRQKRLLVLVGPIIEILFGHVYLWGQDGQEGHRQVKRPDLLHGIGNYFNIDSDSRYLHMGDGYTNTLHIGMRKAQGDILQVLRKANFAIEGKHYALVETCWLKGPGAC